MVGINEYIDTMMDNILVEVKEEDKEETQQTIADFKDEVMEVVSMVKESLEDDKLTVQEMLKIIIELAEAIQFVLMITELVESKEQMKSITLDLVKEIYYSEDGLNNPDLKKVPDWLEKHLESLFFKYVAPAVVSYVMEKFYDDEEEDDEITE